MLTKDQYATRMEFVSVATTAVIKLAELTEKYERPWPPVLEELDAAAHKVLDMYLNEKPSQVLPRKEMQPDANSTSKANK